MRARPSLPIATAILASAALAACAESSSHPGGPGSSGHGGGGPASSSVAGSGGQSTLTTGGSGGGAGGGGGSGGSSGSGGSGGATTRVFAFDGGNDIRQPLLELCDASGSCPEGQTCFRLTTELAVCDVPQRAIQNTCSFTTDECECTGRVCGSGTVCVTINYSFHYYNVCAEPACARPSDCSGGKVCTPASLILGSTGTGTTAYGRCFTPLCRSDADCTGGTDGRCALVELGDPQGDRHMQKVGCVFAGAPASATACSPGDAIAVRAKAASPTPAYYTCANR